MTVYSFIEYALLAISVIATLVGCVGVMAMRDLYDKLHYQGLATSLGALLLAAAISVQQGAQPATGKAIIAAVAVAITSPVLAHATARAARTRQFGHWNADLPQEGPVAQAQDMAEPLRTEEIAPFRAVDRVPGQVSEG